MSKSDFVSVDPQNLTTAEVHQRLLSAVAPRPIGFASTIDSQGRVNLSPFSFFNVFSANPPVLIFSPARRGRDNTTKHTYENVLEVPEVCISVVNYPMVQQMSLASSEYGREVNEFVKAGFTQVDSDTIKPPRVGEAPASFECKVLEVNQLGKEGGAGNLVICEVLKMHFRKEYLDENGVPDTTKLDMVARMGGMWYCRANGDALFEVHKPGRDLGIGIDALPKSITDSSVLSKNELARLGGLHQLPTEEESDQAFAKLEGVQNEEDLHKSIKSLIDQNAVSSALKLAFYKLSS